MALLKLIFINFGKTVIFGSLLFLCIAKLAEYTETI